jgi:hypothetical protein
MWFTSDGKCLYTGGITTSRGHEGDNVGLDSLVELLNGRQATGGGVPAMGCRLCLPAGENLSHPLAGDR